MNRSTLFCMLVQTYALQRRPPLSAMQAVLVVDEAWHVPEEALPEDKGFAKGVEEFVRYVLKEESIPQWLADYEAEKKKAANITKARIRLSEHEARAWWFEAERLAPDAPLEVRGIIQAMVTGRQKDLIVEELKARIFVGWMKSLPGFDPSEWPFSFTVVPRQKTPHS